MKRDPIDSFIDTFVPALHNQNAAIFAGAGLSIPAGLVNWKQLLKSIASNVGLDVDKEDDLITIAQFHVNEHGGRHQINQALIGEFAKRAKPTAAGRASDFEQVSQIILKVAHRCALFTVARPEEKLGVAVEHGKQLLRNRVRNGHGYVRAGLLSRGHDAVKAIR